MFKKALITGGAGFIGSHICEEILSNGKKAVVFDNLSVGKEDNIPKEAEFIKGDILNKEALENAMKGCDTVFHNAAFVSIRGSFEKLRHEVNSNCIGTLNVFESAVNSGVKKLIYASSMAVYGHPQNVIAKEQDLTIPNSFYGYSKLRGEEYAKLFEKEYGLKTVCLRYFNTYGQRQTPSEYVGVTTTFINNVLNNKPMIIYGDGEQTRDFVWVKDVAQANYLAAESSISNEVFNVGSGKSMKISAIAKMIQEKIGGEIQHGPVPNGEIRNITADISKIQNKLGFAPKGNFEKEIGKIIEWRKSK
ncbi:MAG: NAD-dependent epimerase/dehydratase family protein [Candidatus Nanoarchaeia archaeon]|nr:NAD-dependent epimerase/dehydratase family protein [Candidatus Nanoarchaeia archaeon]MDD5054511.1 NAD-dependent epimerase/dehydratase family protein [Candidatus Nanoarchaeia archaeon]MDD5499742.1 NAD-dependent epimerase/dehydratase family protein [Candidatus Nanoarchaeia archaeon]